MYLTTLNLKPASCHLLLMKMADAVCAQQSHFGPKILIKALWDWWTGKLFTGWEKYPVIHLNCCSGTLSQCNDVCSTTSFLEEQSAVSFCVLNKQTLCGNVGIGHNRFFFFLISKSLFVFRTLTLANACDWFVALKKLHGGNNYCNNIRNGSAVKIKHRSV